MDGDTISGFLSLDIIFLLRTWCAWFVGAAVMYIFTGKHAREQNDIRRGGRTIISQLVNSFLGKIILLVF